MKANTIADPILQDVADQFMQEQDVYVAHFLFPQFNSAQKTGVYRRFIRENMLQIPDSLSRAPGTAYTRSQMRIDEQAYACDDRGHEGTIDQDEYTTYANAFDLDAAEVRRLTRVVLADREKRAHAQATGANVAKSTPATLWDAASSDPIGDMLAASEVIRMACGTQPNRAVMSKPVFNALQTNDQIVDRIKYSGGVGNETPAKVALNAMAQLFELDEIRIAGTVLDSANEGGTLSPADVWGKSVVLAVVNDSQSLRELNFGRFMSWTGRIGAVANGVAIGSYEERKISSWVHQAVTKEVEHLTANFAGYHLEAVIS